MTPLQSGCRRREDERFVATDMNGTIDPRETLGRLEFGSGAVAMRYEARR
jgi:hypothetical protein